MFPFFTFYLHKISPLHAIFPNSAAEMQQSTVNEGGYGDQGNGAESYWSTNNQLQATRELKGA